MMFVRAATYTIRKRGDSFFRFEVMRSTIPYDLMLI